MKYKQKDQKNKGQIIPYFISVNNKQVRDNTKINMD